MKKDSTSYGNSRVINGKNIYMSVGGYGKQNINI